MSNTRFLIFGESNCNINESNYTYANALTIDIMDRLADDSRFLDCTQADVLNLALVILYGFVAHEEHDEESKAKLQEFVEDFNEFKDFAIFTMNISRRNNVLSNSMLDVIMEKETEK